MKNTTTLSAILLLVVAFTSGGCKKKTESIEELDTKDAKPAVDPALAEAVAAASASAAPSGEAATAEGGPPQNGVFAPGKADQELVRGAAPKITLGGEGSAPRVQLTGLPPLGKHPMRVRFAQLSGRGGIPLDLNLSLEVTQPASDSADAGGGTTGRTVVATVESAQLDAARLAQQAPESVAAEITKLKGSQVSFVVDESGCGRDFTVEASKAAGGGQNDMLSSLGGLLATVTLPVPTKPVGQGAMWMATTREMVMGIDTLSYRLLKVEGFDGGNVTIKIDTKRYAADARQVVPTLGKDGAVEFQAFQAEGTGSVTVPTAGGFPLEGKINRDLRALLITGSSNAQPMMMQERVEGVFESQAAETAGDTAAAPPAPTQQPPTPPAPAPPTPPGAP